MEKFPFSSAMVWKPLTVAEKSWRKLNTPKLLQDVYEGQRFKDGVVVKTKPEETRKAA